MIELVKTIIEQICKHIDFEAILKLKRASKLGNVGVRLFSLYIVANEMYTNGMRIISSLEDTIKYFTSWRENYGIEYQTVRAEQLFRMIEAQRGTMSNFVAIWDELRSEATILDPEFARAVEDIRESKSRIISLASQVIFEFIKELERASNHTPSHLFSTSKERWLIKVFNEEIERGASRRSLPEFKADEESLPNIDPFPIESVKLILSYIKEQEPRKQLEEFRTVLDHFYEALTKNFEVADIILKVGQRRHSYVGLFDRE